MKKFKVNLLTKKDKELKSQQVVTARNKYHAADKAMSRSGIKDPTNYVADAKLMEKFSHTNFKNIATAEKQPKGNRYENGRFVILREAIDDHKKNDEHRFYVVVGAKPIHDHYLTKNEAANLFTEQFEG